MRILHLSALLFLLISCKELKKNKPVSGSVENVPKQELPFFFPVTSYLKGQVFEIKNKGINPLKIIKTENLQDSSWIKMEDLDKTFSDFLLPEIDSANLVMLFAEKKFFDQTLDAITLTYDPIKILPDSLSLRHWDVYIDPETNSVRRIYLVKKISMNKTAQLTWQSNKWCRMVTITEDAAGNSSVEKEVTIKWDF